ncbi:soluble NSF attachment protein [Xylariaceae sp. FL1272]|nr:soluble NSF attachment protein [Xylariaceae sp. FL1272]
MSASNDPRALMQQADKTLASAGGGFLRNFFSSEDKYETAVTLYEQAAKAFKKRGEQRECAQAYEKASNVALNHTDNRADMIKDMDSAIDEYKKKYPREALRCLDMLAQYFQDENETERAAKKKVQMAVILEDLQDDRGAMKCYEEAGDLREDKSPITARSHFLKAVMCMIRENEFHKAIQTFGKINRSFAKDNNVSNKYSYAKALVNQGLCYLAIDDPNGAATAIATYKGLQQAGADKDLELLSKLKEAMDRKDQEIFAKVWDEWNGRFVGEDREARQHILEHMASYYFPIREAQQPKQYPSQVFGQGDEDGLQ